MHAPGLENGARLVLVVEAVRSRFLVRRSWLEDTMGGYITKPTVYVILGIVPPIEMVAPHANPTRFV